MQNVYFDLREILILYKNFSHLYWKIIFGELWKKKL